MKKKVVILSHAVFTEKHEPLHGSGSSLESYLIDKDVDTTIIKFPIIGQHDIWVENINKRNERHQRISYISSHFIPIRAVFELIQTLRLLRGLGRISLLIGIDPLNATYSLLLKHILKIDKIIYYTADYAHQRFSNPILNGIYHRLDEWCISKVDQVWNVSTRITELRDKQGVELNRNFFVPNSPEYGKVKRVAKSQKNVYELVIVSSSPTAVNIPFCLNAVSLLKKKYPKINLKVIGLGEWSRQFQSIISKLKIEKRVSFLNSISHQELQTELSKAGIGIALYTNQSAWTYFSDSMKVRDYLAAGLPVIMTDVMSTAEDIKSFSAGEVIELNQKQLVVVIDKILNDNNYHKYHQQAIKLAVKQDATKILNRVLLPLIH